MTYMKTNILAIGRNEEILAVVVRLINANPDWEGKGACTDNEAIALFSQHSFDIVLLCNGIQEDEETRLCAEFVHLKPNILVIQHYGGGSGLLSNEIRYALEKSQDTNGKSRSS